MASSFRFLHAADLHIDSPLRDLDSLPPVHADRIRRATRRAFENLVDLAISEKVAFVVLAGDIFDGDWRDFGSGIFFAQELSRLGASGIQTFVLRGNHDAASVITRRLQWPSSVFEFASDEVSIFQHAATGTHLIGRSFAKAAETQNLAALYPKRSHGGFTIGVLHTALGGRQGHDNYAPCNVDDLRRNDYDYWALGHVHAHEIVNTAPYIVFPGNLQGRHVRETGAKGCVIVDVVDGKVAQVKHHAVDVVRYADEAIEVSMDATLESVRDRIRAGLRRLIDASDRRLVVARIRILGETPLDADLRFHQGQIEGQCRVDAAELGDVLIRECRILTRDKDHVSTTSLSSQLSLDDKEIQRRALEHPDVQKFLTELAKELGADPTALANLEKELLDDARGLVLRALSGDGVDDE